MNEDSLSPALREFYQQVRRDGWIYTRDSFAKFEALTEEEQALVVAAADKEYRKYLWGGRA